ncbi:MAG: 2-phospho-L-lactate guanylyltransferase [Pseudomonadota bacterium]
MKNTLITVPLKEPTQSKTRLAPILSDESRLNLVHHLYQRTLAFLRPIGSSLGVGLSVVTSSQVAADMARLHGFVVIDEPPQVDLCGAITYASSWACAAGYERLCVVHADLATPEISDLLALLQCEAEVAICASDDWGTNALLVSPPDAIPFQYGHQSASQHLREARSRGLVTELMPHSSLAYDIDTAVCLDRAKRCVPGVAQICS